jgi:hypothetical protein
MAVPAPVLRRTSTGRMMSWDSDAFGAMSMVHSSWGSSLTASMLGSVGAGTGTGNGGILSCTPRAAAAAANAAHMEAARAPAVGIAPPQLATAQASPADAFSPEMRASLAARGLRLLAFACDAGWPSTARMLVDLLTTLPLVAAQEHRAVPLAQLAPWQLVPHTMQEVLGACLGADGLTPVHRAARSGSLATVRELQCCAAEAGLALNWAARGQAALSPLHFAALASDGGKMAGLLLGSAPDAPLQWFLARSQDRKTPAQLAMAAEGGAAINQQARMMVHVLALKGSQGRSNKATAAAAGAGSRGGQAAPADRRHAA